MIRGCALLPPFSHTPHTPHTPPLRFTFLSIITMSRYALSRVEVLWRTWTWVRTEPAGLGWAGLDSLSMRLKSKDGKWGRRKGGEGGKERDKEKGEMMRLVV